MVVHSPILIPKTENLLRLESQKTLAFGKQNIAASGLNSLREKLTQVLSEKAVTFARKKACCQSKESAMKND